MPHVCHRRLYADSSRQIERNGDHRRLLLPACQNGFALKQLSSTPGQGDRDRDQGQTGNDRYRHGQLELAGELVITLALAITAGYGMLSWALRRAERQGGIGVVV
jgi:hypothetical protein